MIIDPYAKEKLKASIRIEDVADHLGLRESLKLHQVGGSLVGHCPNHSSKSGTCFKLHKDANCFHCFSCGESYDIISLVEKVKGLSFPETCKYIAERFRPDLLEEILNSNLVAPETKKTFYVSSLYEAVFEYGKDLLFKKEGSVALEYLIKIRGYDTAKLKETDWIYWPKDEEIRAHLKSGLPNERHHEVDSLILNGIGGDVFRVALPYRDRLGRILGFAKRAAVKEGIKVGDKLYRWSYTKGLEKPDLFGLHRCKRSKHSKQLLLVEGLPDAAYLPSLGIENIVAVGQGDLSEKHIDGLKIYEIESAIISFDNDKPNEKGEIGSVEKAKKAADLLEENGIKAFIFPQHYLGDHKDPDEFVRANGVEAFQKLVKEGSQSRAKWLPWYHSYNKNLQTELGIYEALSDIAKDHVSLVNAFDKRILEDEVERIFGISKEEIKSVFSQALETQRKKEEEEKRKKCIAEMQMALQKGDIAKAQALLSEIEKDPQKAQVILSPYTVVDLRADLSKIKEGLKTGYTEFDKEILIPQSAMTVLAGRPGHGKTTTLLNLFVNMVNIYTDRSFYFFSYEETRSQILLKILNILAGKVISEATNLANLEGYVKGGHKMYEEINTATELLQKLTESGRLIITDKRYYVDEMSHIISNTCKKRGNVGAVFIDYIQKIKIKGKFNSRQLECQAMSGDILETAKSNLIPIILGAQFGRANGREDTLKMENLREAGDFEQDANLLVGIWNQAKDEAGNSDKRSTGGKTDLELNVIKNRNGPDGQKIVLEFDRPLCKLNEKKNDVKPRDWSDI